MMKLSGCASGTRSGARHRGRIGLGRIPRPVPTRPDNYPRLTRSPHLILPSFFPTPNPKRSISNARICNGLVLVK